MRNIVNNQVGGTIEKKNFVELPFTYNIQKRPSLDVFRDMNTCLLAITTKGLGYSPPGG